MLAPQEGEWDRMGEDLSLPELMIAGCEALCRLCPLALKVLRHLSVLEEFFGKCCVPCLSRFKVGGLEP